MNDVGGCDGVGYAMRRYAMRSDDLRRGNLM